MKYWKKHLCFKCRQIVKALVVLDEYVSDNSRLLRLECPACHFTEAKLADKQTYNQEVCDGK